MLKPKNLSATGFRGVSQTRRLDLQKPLVLLWGENHQGKSSMINSLEWALYGDECTGNDTGIRERVDWEIANRHFDPRRVEVAVELCDGAGSYFVKRTLARQGRRATLQESLTLVLPDGTKLEQEAAALKLGTLLTASFRDFASTVYQHQEAIRAVLTQKPQERNDAIDRLLGLSDFRNLQSGIDGAKVGTVQRDLVRDYEGFKTRIETAVKTRANDLDARRRAAGESGLAPAELNEKGAALVAKRALGAIVQFAAEAQLPAPACALPATWKDVKAFRKLAKAAIDRLRAGLPETKHQAELLQKRTELLSRQNSFDQTKRRRDEASKELAAFEKEHGGQADLHSRLQQLDKLRSKEDERQRQANARSRLVSEGINYLEKAGMTGLGSPCPLCGTDAANLLEHLRQEWEQEIGAQAREIEEALAKLKTQKAALEASQRQRERLASAVTEAESELTVAREQAGKAIGRALGAQDDPPALLALQLEQVKKSLERLEKAMNEKQRKLAAVDEDLERLGVIHDILELEERGRIIEQVRSSEEFKRLEAQLEQLAEFVEDVQQVKAAIGKAATGAADKRLGAAERTIDEYFRRIAANPACNGLKLTVQADARGRNSYEFTDHAGRDLVPVLSQGDMNALALAIFLGLACTSADANRFGFVMLDDPSQSLGSRHKAQLAEVLSEVLAKKAVILSTMDAELRELLAARVTKESRTYVFSNWTPEDGPTIVPA